MRTLGSIFRRLRAGGMASPACCDGGGVIGPQPGGNKGELGGELSGELGTELKGEVRSEKSSGVMFVVSTTWRLKGKIDVMCSEGRRKGRSAGVDA